MKSTVIYFSLIIQIYAQTVQIYVDKNFVQEGEFCNVIYTEAHEYDLEAEIINE